MPRTSPGIPSRIDACEREPVTVGKSTAEVYRLRHADAEVEFLKCATGEDAEALRAEHDRLRWLVGRAPVPRVLGFECEHGWCRLLTAALPGADATQTAVSQRPARVAGVAQALRELHAVPITQCPFDQCANRQIARARARVAAGRVDEADFDDERAGLHAVDLLAQLQRERPDREDLVLTHGDACLPNLIFDGARFSGFVDCGRAGIADRCQDLALAAHSIAHNFGADLVPAFFAAYDLPAPDSAKLAWYRLLDEFF